MFCLDLWSVCVLYLAAGSRKSPILFSFQVLTPLLSFSPHVVSFFLSLLFTTGIQVFGPGTLLAVLRGARCTFVLLSGPVWAFGGGASQKHWDSSIVPLHSAQRATVRRVFGRGWGGCGWGWGLSVTADCHRFSPASSRSVLPLVEPQGRQMHLPEIHTPGPDAYLPTPSPRFYRNAACATHWCPFTLLKRAQRDIRLYSTSLWNLELSVNLQNF